MQQELFRRGGKRAGAGRKPKNGRAGVSHARREEVRASWPVHVTLRVARGLYLRKRSIWRAIAKATMAAAKTIRVVHASVQHDHLHILVEASDRTALAKGMLAFQVSAAHWINRAAERSGRVFADRYHARVIKTPREARSAIRYVLSNWRKHGEDVQLRCAVDPFSTGYAFWNERVPIGYEPLPVSGAESWLLRAGWRKAGEISPYEAPRSR
ncbi:MAG TPA: transposase [Kofleriaceae bacterium]